MPTPDSTNSASYRLTVVDGALPAGFFSSANMEPDLTSQQEDLPVLQELMRREPLFHSAEFGTTRKDFERMTASSFREVGASGRRYSRQFVLDGLEKKFKNPIELVWEVRDFHCFKIAPGNYLATYTLVQGERVTRRATIWRRLGRDWQAVYHQGTVVEP